MKLSELLEFRKDLYFEGAVQIDWFYNQEKSKKVAENFVFHGSEYFGIENKGQNKRIDTIALTKEIAEKVNTGTSNPLSLAIADYGTGKSHLAVTLAQLLSGNGYMPNSFVKIIDNISKVEAESAKKISSLCDKKNLVIVINGMRDFNLHSELLKAAEKSLTLYNVSDAKLRKINRSVETAEMFIVRNATTFSKSFESQAAKYNWKETGKELTDKLLNELLVNEEAYNIINNVYEEVNGYQIRWDEGISASAILEQLVNEYCGINGVFDSVVILFDEFGRYLEYASGVDSTKSGDSALQQIFECSQNSDGKLHVINFIQSDIKSYLQRVDNTKNISRYIGRFDVSDKYYISSNLETVFANLIQRKDPKTFNSIIVKHINENDAKWEKIFKSLNSWKSLDGVWADYPLYKKVIVEGIYPMHPISSFMLTQLSDYLQNRSSLTMISQYFQHNVDTDIMDGDFVIYPEELMRGDLFVEMLAAEQEGRQSSQHCLLYSNVLSKFEDKLSEQSLMVLRCNLILRILKLKTNSIDEVKEAMKYCCPLSMTEIDENLDILVNEYGILGYDDRANCFDFMEETNGAHDYKIIKKRALKNAEFDHSLLENGEILDLAEFTNNIETQFGTNRHISTKEWEFVQEVYWIDDFNEEIVNKNINDWKQAVYSNVPKGRIIWLYLNKNSNSNSIDNVSKLVARIKGYPIMVMLLNDVDNHLCDDLIEYSVLRKLDEQTKNRYSRHYEDDLKQNQNMISVDFANLKKERLSVTPEGIEPLKDRLAKSLTSVFDLIYPKVISFPFDGFVSAKYNISKNQAKTYISILKSLLSGEINDAVIHNWPIETRNRFVALFDTKARNSWKCLNEQAHIVPPEDENVKNIYDLVLNKLEQNKEVKCSDIINTLLYPPYGVNYDAVVMIVAIVVANFSYCTRVKYKEETLSIQSWRDLLLVKDDKIRSDIFDASTLIQIDVSEISTKFTNLFKQIEDNKDADRVNYYSAQLDKLLLENEIPEELEARCGYNRKLLNDGLNAKKDFNEKLSQICADEIKISDKDLYPAIKIINDIENTDFAACFKKYHYDYTSQYSGMVSDKAFDMKEYIDEGFDVYLSTLRCSEVERLISYRNHTNKLVDLFKEAGFVEYASRIKEQARQEMDNVELIKSRASFRSDYFDFYNKCQITKFTSFSQMRSWSKECGELIKRYNMFKNSLKDADRIRQGLIEKRDVIKQELDVATEEIGNIFDDSYELENLQDINSLQVRITDTLKRGLDDKDVEDLDELLNDLETLKNDVISLNELSDDREKLTKYSDDLITKYKNSDSDLLNEETIVKFIDSAKQKTDDLEEKWVNNYLTLGKETDQDLFVWKSKYSSLPLYLSKNTLSKAEKLNEKADGILKKRKIETVLHYYNELTKDEKEEFLKLIK